MNHSTMCITACIKHGYADAYNACLDLSVCVRLSGPQHVRVVVHEGHALPHEVDRITHAAGDVPTAIL